MTSFTEISNCWRSNDSRQSVNPPINHQAVNKWINAGMKKQQKTILEYLVLSGFWQWLIYSALSYLIIRFWGNGYFAIYCIGLILLYIPFTIVFIRKFRWLRIVRYDDPGLGELNIYHVLNIQYKTLNDFYYFKKRLDWFTIPGNCFVICMIIYQYGWIPSLTQNALPGLIIFSFYLVAFVIATVMENRKHFINPIKRLNLLIREWNEEVDNEISQVKVDH
jgi:hypothetical protein